MKKIIYNKFIRVFINNPIYFFKNIKEIYRSYLIGFNTSPILLKKDEFGIVSFNDCNDIILDVLFKEIEISSLSDKVVLFVSPDNYDFMLSNITKLNLKCTLVKLVEIETILDYKYKKFIYLDSQQDYQLRFESIRRYIKEPLFVYINGEVNGSTKNKKTDALVVLFNSSLTISLNRFYYLV